MQQRASLAAALKFYRQRMFRLIQSDLAAARKDNAVTLTHRSSFIGEQVTFFALSIAIVAGGDRTSSTEQRREVYRLHVSHPPLPLDGSRLPPENIRR